MVKADRSQEPINRSFCNFIQVLTDNLSKIVAKKIDHSDVLEKVIVKLSIQMPVTFSRIPVRSIFLVTIADKLSV